MDWGFVKKIVFSLHWFALAYTIHLGLKVLEVEVEFSSKAFSVGLFALEIAVMAFLLKRMDLLNSWIIVFAIIAFPLHYLGVIDPAKLAMVLMFFGYWIEETEKRKERLEAANQAEQ